MGRGGVVVIGLLLAMGADQVYDGMDKAADASRNASPGVILIVIIAVCLLWDNKVKK